MLFIIVGHRCVGAVRPRQYVFDEKNAICCDNGYSWLQGWKGDTSGNNGPGPGMAECLRDDVTNSDLGSKEKKVKERECAKQLIQVSGRRKFTYLMTDSQGVAVRY